MVAGRLWRFGTLLNGGDAYGIFISISDVTDNLHNYFRYKKEITALW